MGLEEAIEEPEGESCDLSVDQSTVQINNQIPLFNHHTFYPMLAKQKNHVCNLGSTIEEESYYTYDDESDLSDGLSGVEEPQISEQ